MLDKAAPDRPGGFRAFFYGVVRNVALRFEQRGQQAKEHPAGEGSTPDPATDRDEGLSRSFDRAWARAVMREAAELMARKAAAKGEAGRRRVELLHARFHDDLPIREIASRWQADPAALHHEYARARVEFRQALLEVMRDYHPGSAADAERGCRELLALLG